MTVADILRDAWRAHRRQPAFAALAVLAFGLALALNTTVYAVLDALIAPEINVDDPGQLYVPAYYESAFRRERPPLREAIEAASTVEAVTHGAYDWRTPVSRGNRASDVPTATVALNFFSVIRPKPLAGRTFTERDIGHDAIPAVISDRLRRTLFRPDEDPIGEFITLGETSVKVLGVLRRETSYPPADVWIPQRTDVRGYYGVIVRVKRGVTFAQAYAEMDLIRARFARERGFRDRDTRIDFEPLFNKPFRVRSFHVALIGSVLAVLLVAALNIANLQLARGLTRLREMATRAAMGATRGMLVRQMLAETTLLAIAGLAVGLLLARWAMALVAATVPSNVAQYVVTPQWSWRVVVASASAGLLVIAVAGALPALRVTGRQLGDVLRSSPGTGASRRTRATAGMLVVGQIALALSLCIAGTLLARTALRFETFDPGFETKHLVSGNIWAGPAASRTAMATTDEFLARVRQLPGVVDAAARFFGGSLEDDALVVEDDGGGRREIALPQFGYSKVTPTYFRTMGVRLARGRPFHDHGEARPAVILNDVAARDWWPRSNPVGRLVKLGSLQSNAPWVEVVGVLPPMEWEMGTEETKPQLFYSHASDTTRLRWGGFGILARSTGDAARTASAIQKLQPHVPGRPSSYVTTFEQHSGLASARAKHRFIASLFASFAALGLALATLGVYAVSAHTVAQRTREFGVRIALGASPTDILGGVLREGNLLGLLGIASGLVIAGWTVGLLHAFLAGMEPFEPLLFGSVAAVLLGVVVVASLPPAIRASAVDPVQSLRND